MRTKQWFRDRIGKIVFRTTLDCDCQICKKIYESGLYITDMLHADYVHMVSNEIGIMYFDTAKERDEYEANNSKRLQ
jgi:hypothetical protein